MTSEAQSHIQKFLYNLSTENYSNADKNLNILVKQKVDKRFNEALANIRKDLTKIK
jgi:hypothetical protein